MDDLKKKNEVLQKKVEKLEKEIKKLRKNKSYGLVWDVEREPEQVVVDCEKKLPVLKEVKSKRICSEKDKAKPMNILIEGDNYHALQVLNYTHKGKIDVIYIDPPYNTGNKDFIYNDSFVDKEDNYRHSKWLQFIEKRLILAKYLLEKSGIIMISIDENEFAQLKLLCDNIFGEQNRLSTQHIKVRYENKSLNEDNDWQPIMEYVLIYAKNKYFFKPNKPSEDYDLGKFKFVITELGKGKTINVGNKKVTIFKESEWKIIEKDKGEIGQLKETWASGSLVRQGGTAAEFLSKYLIKRKEEDGLNVLYKIYNMGEDGLGYRYVTGPKKFNAIRGKYYSGVPISRIEEIKTNGTALKQKPITNYLDYSPDFCNILHEGGISFNNGKKPIKLLKELINYHPKKNSKILDFFAGSGSTAHAVLDINRLDGGTRQFIICTNNENNVCSDKCYPRVKKVIDSNVLKYFKTDFVDVDGLSSISDEKRLKLTFEAGEIIALKEDVFDEVEKNEFFQIFEGKDKVVGIYFLEDHERLDELIEKLNKSKVINKVLYLFSWGKNEYLSEDFGDNIVVKDIPEPIIQVYKKINSM